MQDSPKTLQIIDGQIFVPRSKAIQIKTEINCYLLILASPFFLYLGFENGGMFLFASLFVVGCAAYYEIPRVMRVRENRAVAGIYLTYEYINLNGFAYFRKEQEIKILRSDVLKISYSDSLRFENLLPTLLLLPKHYRVGVRSPGSFSYKNMALEVVPKTINPILKAWFNASSQENFKEALILEGYHLEPAKR